jgi:hypothetical protein
MRYHNHGTGKLIEIQSLKSKGGKFHVRAPAFFLWPEKNDAGVAAGPVSSQIGKTFVRCNQPTPFKLNARPDNLIGKALPTLLHNRCGVMAACGKRAGHLTGQVLIDFEAGTHRLVSNRRGIKSALFTASAANFRAALMSSAVS